ncbi:TauD/TfdA family dioxygenase [Thermopolyspora sp. NPDC052614]|uniref:TauD/TfdA family dioxygenase n=1 Tax=Thermopolyspora sp. NPDC052614 TaxID=3155682 RepID=UPI003415C6BD
MDGPRTERTTDGHRLKLTGAERAAVWALAVELTGTTPGLIDDLDWVARARRLSSGLPERLRQAIREFRHDPGDQGALIISNLPVAGYELPNTPDMPQSVERIVSPPAATVMLAGLQLGEVVAYREEKHGALVQNIVPVPGLETSQSNAGAVPLEFHIENAFHPFRPDYVGLLCLRSDHLKQAGTTVASMRHALSRISDDDLAVLREPRFATSSPPSFQTDLRSGPHPLIDGAAEDPNLLVDFNATVALDDEAGAVLKRLRAVLDDVTTAVVLQPGDMVFVDNRTAVHGRTHFTPRYDGKDRWLLRVHIHLDNRRSRVRRPGNGPVMI